MAVLDEVGLTAREASPEVPERILSSASGLCRIFRPCWLAAVHHRVGLTTRNYWSEVPRGVLSWTRV